MWPRLKYVSILLIFYFKYNGFNKNVYGPINLIKINFKNENKRKRMYNDEVINNNMTLPKSLKPVTED